MTTIKRTETKNGDQRFTTTPRFRDNVTGYLFIAPAMLVIIIFGLIPIGYAVYMSFHRWWVRKRGFFCEATYEKPFSFDGLKFWEAELFHHPGQVVSDCFSNYHTVVGDWGALAITIAGFATLYAAYWVWTNAFKPGRRTTFFSQGIGLLPFATLIVALIAAGQVNVFTNIAKIAGLDNVILADPNSLAGLPITVGLLLIAAGASILPGLRWIGQNIIKNDDDQALLLQIISALFIIALSFAIITYGWDRMSRAAKQLCRRRAFPARDDCHLLLCFWQCSYSIGLGVSPGLCAVSED